jgi:AcrR family transcriptional regulator
MGYEEATTNHIAAQAEISPGSLYQFFSNKEEIAQALATRYTEELQQAYDSIFSVEAQLPHLSRPQALNLSNSIFIRLKIRIDVNISISYRYLLHIKDRTGRSQRSILHQFVV